MVVMIMTVITVFRLETLTSLWDSNTPNQKGSQKKTKKQKGSTCHNVPKP